MIRRLLMAALLAIPIAALAVPAQAGKTSGAQTFTCTEREKAYRIPATATTLDIVVIGARGIGLYGVSSYGARVNVVVDVSSLPAGTSKLYVEVGCTSTNGRYGDHLAAWNGGGVPGLGYGGGGASDVRLDSRRTALTDTDSRIVVAGGGGGDAYCYLGGVEGPVGGSAGSGPSGAGAGGTGNDLYGVPYCVGAGADGPGGNSGYGGSAGGLGGTGYATGGAGSLGQGGAVQPFNSYGGSGGGGYWGGGAGGDGGAAGGGGGAGSSYWDTAYVDALTATMTTATTSASITITPSFT